MASIEQGFAPGGGGKAGAQKWQEIVNGLQRSLKAHAPRFHACRVCRDGHQLSDQVVGGQVHEELVARGAVFCSANDPFVAPP
jgi:hypothetical protein